MSIPISHTLDEEGKLLLKTLQDTFSKGNAARELTDSNGNVKYTNHSLDVYAVPLLKHLNLSHLGYTAWRILAPITISNATGPEYIIPITDISDKAHLVPGGKLQADKYVYHTGTVELHPSLVCIFVAKGRAG
ncbi:hypothetical protein LOZ58_006896 [Ophidiomyces ophidiicola]|nr:hypothetical protein LOZ58_006896 [Ophidiomyces ophidiicola]